MNPAPTPAHLALIVCLMTPFAGAEQTFRTWTSSDGRTLEASYVKSTDDSVTIRTREGREFVLPFSKLAEDDAAAARAMAAGSAAESQRVNGLTEGPYAESITGEWQKMKSAEGIEYHFFAGKRLKTDQLYPLCIYLHGSSNIGSNLTKREPGASAFAKKELYDQRPCFVISPEAPAGVKSFKEIVPKMTALVADLVAHLPIDPDRIYLTGYSMGSRGTIDWIAAEPALFAAGVPLGGFPNPSIVAKLPKSIALWLQWGELDRAEEARAFLAAVEAAGIPAKGTEHPGAGHSGFHWKVAEDESLHEWLFAQKRQPLP